MEGGRKIMKILKCWHSVLKIVYFKDKAGSYIVYGQS